MQTIRIQRKRVKGWKKPENTVNVSRPGKWGNPFKLQQTISRSDIGVDGDVSHTLNTNKLVVLAYRYWLDNTIEGAKIKEAAKNELKGKNLMCFCSLSHECHADVLLDIANS